MGMGDGRVTIGFDCSLAVRSVFADLEIWLLKNVSRLYR